MEKLLAVIGRIIYSVPFLAFGFGHVTNAPAMSGMVPLYIPGAIFWVYFSGAAMILAGLAIITGVQARAACLGLGLMLAIFIVTIQLPGMANPQTHMMSLVNGLKDTGLLGAALVIASTFPAKKKKKE
jgi:uncharacterized membrane protein YphA (DoxX/SURF4 family)